MTLRRNQYRLSDLLADVASGQKTGIQDRKWLMDLSEYIGRFDVRTKQSLLSLSEKIRGEGFTPAERRALFLIRSYLNWVNPDETDPFEPEKQ